MTRSSPAPSAVSRRSRSARWSSFVAEAQGDPTRILHELGNPAHRLRVEHNDTTLLVHLSDETGTGWTVLAIDRQTRAWAVAQGAPQEATAERAYDELYRPR